MSTFRYIPQIDFLRAIAVVSVMIYHLNASLLPGGFSGVDVFFVISGYVVSASLAQQDATSFLQFARHFYAKRILRIVPALLVCLLVTTIINVLFIPQSWLSEGNQSTGLAAFFGISNLDLMKKENDYFAPRAEFNPFTHTWSLGVEEQFYLIFPALLYVWIRFRNTLFLHSGTALLLLLLLLSAMFSGEKSVQDQSVAFYSLPSRFWELASGALLFELHSQNRLLTKNGYVIVASLALIFVGFAFAQVQAFPMPWALCAVLGTLGVIACVAAGDTSMDRIISHRVPVYVGKISYSLYLWHWPVYVMFRWTVGLDSWFHQLAAVTLTVGLSVVSYTYLENTVRYSAFFRQCRNGTVVAGGITILVACYVFAKGIDDFQHDLTLSVTRNERVWYVTTPSTEVIQPSGCHTVWSKFVIDGGWGTNSRKTDCEHPAKNLFVIGDSHATAYMTLLRKFGDEQNVNVFVYTGPGCGFLTLLRSMKAASDGCQIFASAALKDVTQKAKPGDVVFLPSLRLRRFGDQWGTFPERTVVESMNGDKALLDQREALKEAHSWVQPFLSVGLHVVFEAPMPIFKSPAFRCSDWFNASNPVCVRGLTLSRDYLQDYRQPIMNSLGILVTTYSDVTVFDPFDSLCPNETCSAFDKGLPLFFDGDHLSGYGNLVLYGPFLNLLNRQRFLD